jgi:hypothetical protein
VIFQIPPHLISSHLISPHSTSDAIAAANIYRSSLTSITKSVQVASVEKQISPRGDGCISATRLCFWAIYFHFSASDDLMQEQDDARWQSFGLCKMGFSACASGFRAVTFPVELGSEARLSIEVHGERSRIIQYFFFHLWNAPWNLGNFQHIAKSSFCGSTIACCGCAS